MINQRIVQEGLRTLSSLVQYFNVWMLRKLREGGTRLKRKMRSSTFSQIVDAAAERAFWGWIFLVFGSVFFLGFVYSAIISKLLPPSENVVISTIQNDRYYCFLVPLTIPILIVAVYFHWLCMKLFKHA